MKYTEQGWKNVDLSMARDHAINAIEAWRARPDPWTRPEWHEQEVTLDTLFKAWAWKLGV